MCPFSKVSIITGIRHISVHTRLIRWVKSADDQKVDGLLLSLQELSAQDSRYWRIVVKTETSPFPEKKRFQISKELS